MSILDEYSALGLTVFTNTIAFRVEVSRKSVVDTVKDIDEKLDTYGIEDDNMARVSAVIHNTNELASMLTSSDQDREVLISEIAYSFVYAYVKLRGSDLLSQTRGIVAMINNDKLFFRTAHNEQDFHDLSEEMAESARQALGVDAYYPVVTDDQPSANESYLFSSEKTGIGPTIH